MSFNRGLDKKMWCIYTMEYCSIIRKDEILSFAITWIDLENIILREISQKKLRTAPHVSDMKLKLIDTDNSMVVTRG